MPWSAQHNTNFGGTEEEIFAIPGTDTVFIAFADTPGGSGNIKIQKSLDGGNTFAAAVTIASSLTKGDVMLNNAIAYDPTVGANGRLFVCYGHDIDNGNKAVLLIARSDDLGATWASDTLDDGTSHSGTNSFYRVGCWAYNGVVSVHWSYEDNTTFLTDGMWRNVGTYTTGSVAWGTKNTFYSTSAAMNEPNVWGFTDGTVLCSWYDNGTGIRGAGDIYIARSSDFGATWGTTPTKLTTSTDFGRPRIKGENGNWWIFAMKPFGNAITSDIYSLNSTDNGVTWSSPALRDTHTTAGKSLSHPDIVIQGQFVAFLSNDINGGHRFFYSTDGGSTFSGPTSPFGDASTGDAPRLINSLSYLIAFGYDSVNSRSMWAMDPDWFAPQPYFRSSATGSVASAGSLVINVPAGVANGDFLIATIGVNGASHVPATPSGWTLVSSEATGPSVAVYKRTASSEPASYTWTTAAGAAGYIAAYQNVAGTPIDVNGTLNRTTASATITALSVTTTTKMDLLLFLAGTGSVGQTVSTDPTGFTRRINFAGGAGFAYLADVPQIATGATGNKSATLTGSASNDALLLALAGLTSAAPANSVAPAITGTVSNGSTLTSTAGTWTNSPVQWKYQWQTSSDGSSWSNVTNATLPFFTVTDGTKYHRCQVTACNEVGCSSASNSNSISPQASGTIGTLTLSSPTGTAAGGAAVSASIGTLTLSASSATGTGGSTATGSIGTLTLSGPGGSAGASASAFGTIGTLTLSAPTASVTGDAAVDGAIPTLNLSSPRATATGGTIGSFVIGGQIETGSISPPMHARPALVKEPA